MNSQPELFTVIVQEVKREISLFLVDWIRKKCSCSFSFTPTVEGANIMSWFKVFDLGTIKVDLQEQNRYVISHSLSYHLKCNFLL